MWKKADGRKKIFFLIQVKNKEKQIGFPHQSTQQICGK